MHINAAGITDNDQRRSRKIIWRHQLGFGLLPIKMVCLLWRYDIFMVGIGLISISNYPVSVVVAYNWRRLKTSMVYRHLWHSHELLTGHRVSKYKRDLMRLIKVIIISICGMVDGVNAISSAKLRYLLGLRILFRTWTPVLPTPTRYNLL